jgi:hypothetical protein
MALGFVVVPPADWALTYVAIAGDNFNRA